MGSSLSRTRATQAEADNTSTGIDATSSQNVTAEEMEVLQEIRQSMPKYIQPETFEQKLYRKVRVHYPHIQIFNMLTEVDFTSLYSHFLCLSPF